MYMIVKHTHLTIIALTFIFFIINFVLTMRGSDKVNNKLLKIGPHILYTLFICTFIYMMIVNPLNLYPFVNGWASSKLGGFVIYVLSITFALKWAKSTLWRIVGLISAIFWLAMSARLAFADHLKSKGVSEDSNAYIDLGQSMLAAIC
ncbi:MAG: putative membrane protein SirB2 [Alteromonadaceae bacterium]|jgi:uncharacterized membrane protein SirB2